MIQPTIGRKIWYWALQSTHDNHVAGNTVDSQPEDATIVYVHSPGLVNLSVINHNGEQRAETSVRLLQDADLIPPSRFATWMPFQIGQAKSQPQS